MDKKQATPQLRTYRIAKELQGVTALKRLDLLNIQLLKVSNDLAMCKHFMFLESSKIKEVVGLERKRNSHIFWHDINAIMILCLRSTSNSLLKVLDSIKWAISSENELAFAFSIRAFIEHASVFNDLTSFLKTHIQLFSEKLWEKNNIYKIHPDEEVFKLREELIRYIFSCKIVFNPDMPKLSDNEKKWNKYLKSLENVPEVIKPKNVMTCIDNSARNRKIRILRTVYALLSEYVHPNSAARTFSFSKDSLGGYFSFIETENISVGFKNIFALSNVVLEDLIEMILDSLSIFQKIMKPLQPLYGSKTYKKGYVKSIDTFGREVWIDKKYISDGKQRGIPLTDKQKERIEKIQRAFRIVDNRPIAEWFNNIQKADNPEFEITIYERLVKVFNEEFKRRNNNKNELIQLYLVINMASLGYNAKQMKIERPDLKLNSFPYLERVVSKVKEALKASNKSPMEKNVHQ